MGKEDLQRLAEKQRQESSADRHNRFSGDLEEEKYVHIDENGLK
jgi:hypothetical protein